MNPLQILEKRQSLLKYFIDTPYHLVKQDVEELTEEAAHSNWEIVKQDYYGACFRAGVGPRRSRDLWTLIMRKMILLRKKAGVDAITTEAYIR